MTLTKEQFNAFCEALPEGMHWGDPITPQMLQEIVDTIRAQADAGPIYQLRLANGDWRDQAQQSYLNNQQHCASDTRVVYLHPSLPAAQGFRVPRETLVRWQVLAMTVAECGAVVTYEDGTDTPNRRLLRQVDQELRAILARAATVAEPSADAKRLEHIVAIGWEGLRKAWERFGEDHECETPLEEIRAVIDADLARQQAAQQQAEPVGDERTPEDDLNATEGVLDAAMCDMPDGFQTDYPTVAAYAHAIWQGYRGLLEEARAVQSGQRAGVAEDAPDMFWDAEDPDRPHDSIHDVVVSAFENGRNVGDVVEVQQAIRLQNIKVRIIADPEDDEEISYEPVSAAPTQQQERSE